ncbi:DUF1858 domain-containing protein [Jannaschia pohangensis]|uniref:Hybrid cluster protein-associated redox disulfide domain-containing protein n=1 Tax=Jannaschia pohangensis TaxID=390807 RepID=A0A1I3IWB3_9RHOB|nr:DUF1858 domain-containing protein [Jannaschia pohangensis]SFI52242.1 hybrid cluster protein-associated redox disulfide domain-containing protein [Jannaschia pohangensis]
MRPQLENPDLAIGDIMDIWPATIPVFLRHRMLCVGCLIRPFHSLSDACAEYGLDEETFLRALREAVQDDDPSAPRPT